VGEPASTARTGTSYALVEPVTTRRAKRTSQASVEAPDASPPTEHRDDVQSMEILAQTLRFSTHNDRDKRGPAIQSSCFEILKGRHLPR
jgi:hypothetical protein